MNKSDTFYYNIFKLNLCYKIETQIWSRRHPYLSTINVRVVISLVLMRLLDVPNSWLKFPRATLITVEVFPTVRFPIIIVHSLSIVSVYGPSCLIVSRPSSAFMAKRILIVVHFLNVLKSFFLRFWRLLMPTFCPTDPQTWVEILFISNLKECSNTCKKLYSEYSTTAFGIQQNIQNIFKRI